MESVYMVPKHRVHSSVIVALLTTLLMACSSSPTSDTTGTGGASSSSSSTTTGTGGGTGGCDVVADDGNDCTTETCEGHLVLADGTPCEVADTAVNHRCGSGICRIPQNIGFDPTICNEQAGYHAYQAGGDELGDLAVTRLNFETDGLVWNVSFFIPVSMGPCTHRSRTVFITEPVDDDVPMSPGVHEMIDLSYLDIDAGEPGLLSLESNRVTVNLTVPLVGKAGEHAFAAITMFTNGCLESCQLVDDPSTGETKPPPAGEDLWCTDGDAFGGCGFMDGPYPGVGNPTKWAINADLISTD